MDIQQVNFMLMAQDMDRAVAFWCDTVGLGKRFASPWWSELTHGDTTVALHGGGDGTFRKTGLGVQVTDVASACAEVVAGGGAVRKPPESRPNEGLTLAEVTDTEGNGFGLSQLDR